MSSIGTLKEIQVLKDRHKLQLEHPEPSAAAEQVQNGPAAVVPPRQSVVSSRVRKAFRTNRDATSVQQRLSESRTGTRREMSFTELKTNVYGSDVIFLFSDTGFWVRITRTNSFQTAEIN